MQKEVFYRSMRQQGKVAYFSVEYKIIESDKPGYEFLEVEATIRYIAVVSYETNSFGDKEYRVLEKRNRVGNTWKMSVNKDRCSLNMSVMVHAPYRSYGIGTLVLIDLLKMATNKFPQASMRGTLSAVDGTDDNTERRNAVYEKRGFKLEGATFSIERLDHLNLDKSIRGVEVTDIADELLDVYERLETLSYDLNTKKAIIKNNTNSYVENVKEIHSLKKYKYLFFIALAAALYFMIF